MKIPWMRQRNQERASLRVHLLYGLVFICVLTCLLLSAVCREHLTMERHPRTPAVPFGQFQLFHLYQITTPGVKSEFPLYLSAAVSKRPFSERIGRRAVIWPFRNSLRIGGARPTDTAGYRRNTSCLRRRPQRCPLCRSRWQSY